MRIATDSYVHATADDARTKAARLNAQDAMFQALRSPRSCVDWGLARFALWLAVGVGLIAWMHAS